MPRDAAAVPARLRLLACLLSAVALSGACSREVPSATPRVVDVTAVAIQPKDSPAVFEFVGQTQSSREVEIRARVDGFLERRVYTEGNLVRAGETLFLMDRKPFEATLQQARGELAQQQARLQVAEANLARVRPLAEQNAVSKKDLDDAVGNEKSARAAVLSAEGSVQKAELNLSYATITSPLSGLSSFAKIQDGAYVSAANNLLTTVAQLDPMWVNFSISENEHLRMRDAVSRGQLKLPAGEQVEVQLVLADGTVFRNRGRISFADPSFSKETGTFLVRATFVNPQGTLRPGQFVRVQVLGVTRPGAILVPQRAVQQGAKSHFVWVVGKDDRAEQRVVETGAWSGDDWVILQGLRAGERVVVDGAIRVTQGVALKVVPHKDAAGPAAPASRRAADPIEAEKAAATRKGRAEPAPRPDLLEERKNKGAAAPLPARVHFAYRESVLDDSAKHTVAGVAAAIREDNGRVAITGYADARGSAGRNRRIAQARAEAVREALIAGGVPGERVSIRQPATVTGSGSDAEARRAEIVRVPG